MGGVFGLHVEVEIVQCFVGSLLGGNALEQLENSKFWHARIGAALEFQVT